MTVLGHRRHARIDKHIHTMDDMLRLMSRFRHGRLPNFYRQSFRKLEALGCHAEHEPVAGTFAWVDCGVDTEVLARQAALSNLLLAPGLLFSPQQATSSKLRVPVAMADQAAPWKVLEQILAQLRR